MAVPGEAACHPVGSCGAGTWGDIPTGADTQFVDASFAGGASDGTKNAPWTTINQAIAAAIEGATIAIAKGRYAENVSVNKRVVIRGKCAGDVEIAGTSMLGAVNMIAAGSQLHGVAVQGKQMGILISNEKMVVEDVLVHDTTGYAVVVSSGLNVSDLTIRRSLIETSEAGLVSFGGALTVEKTVVRDIQGGDPASARCVNVQSYSGITPRASVTSSLLERCLAGVHAGGADVTVEATAIRDTTGRGIEVQPGDDDAKSTATIRTTVVERASDIGIAAFGGTTTLDRVVVSGVRPAADKLGGAAVWIQYDSIAKQKATAAITGSTFQDGHEAGVANYGADVSLASTIIRRVQPTLLDDSYGDGLLVTRYMVDATSAVSGLRVESVARAALSNFGAKVAMRSTVLECNGIDLNGEASGKAFSFDNSGGNVCGCHGATSACQVQSTALTPPKARDR